MNRSSLALATTVSALVLSATAFADTRSATACAASLTVDQKAIFHSVLPDLKGGVDLPWLIRSKVMALAAAGQLKMSSAPEDALIAGRCLKLVDQ